MRDYFSPPVRWWTSKEKVHEKVFDSVAQLLMRNTWHREDLYINHRLYGSLRNNEAALESDISEYMTRIRLNIVKQVADTAQARIAKVRPKPMFLTGGNTTEKKKAKKLGYFMEGVDANNHTDEIAQDAFLEAAYCGAAAVKIFDDNGKIKHERIYSPELVLDFDECRYGVMYTAYQVKIMNKFDIAEMFPKTSEGAKSSERMDLWNDPFLSQSSNYGYNNDMIPIIEAWRAPIGKAKGRHTIVTSNGTHLDEEWDMKVPIEMCWYMKPQMGIWGEGLGYTLRGMQIEINKLLRDIQSIIHLGCIPKIFLESGSDIVRSHLNNEIGHIVEYSGTRPTMDQLLRVPPDLWRQVEFLYTKSHEMAGFSQMAIGGTVPAGLESGKAIREHNDVEQERFSIVSQGYERFRMRIWTHSIEYAKKLYKDDKKFSILSLDRNNVEKINWKEVELQEDSYLQKLYPIGSLSKSPSGRIEDVDKLMQSGLVNQEEGLYLLDFPDTERFLKFRNSIRTSFESVIDEITTKGEYTPPTPMYDEVMLLEGVTFMRNNYFYYKSEGLDPEKLELITRWINDAIGLIQEMQADAMPPEQRITEQEVDEQAQLELMEEDPEMQEELDEVVEEELINQGIDPSQVDPNQL